jgi:predicted ATPase/tetratricopeptide (TPR) repeat protein
VSTFADLLVELRLGRGLSQEALAARAAVSVRAISDLERGTTRRPHRDTVRALADALALDTADRDRFTEAAHRTPPPSSRRRAGRPPPALPAPVTSILGRDADLAAVARLVRDPRVRLVTVTGPGGIGKTRLAIEVGWRVHASFDRVNAVDLSPLGHPDDVPAALTAAVGCRPADTVAAHVGDTRWLLVIDSFEHLAGAAGGLAELLAACPRLSLLVTSRAPLRLRGEHLWPLAPLPIPDDAAAVTDSPAVALLVERTRAVRPGFAVGPANAATVADLCRRLDGLPLAIELAAAHLRTREPAELVAQLGLTDLRADAVDLPDRHQTLRRTVEWSTGRLAAHDRLLLAVLAVFPGGATPAALRAVLAGAGLDVPKPDGSVSLLVASSLVTVADRAGAARIGMLDTIREIAIDLLASCGAGRAVRAAHAGHFLDLVRSGPDGVDPELDNVRAAVAWSAAREPMMLDAPLARALTAYFTTRGRFADGARTLTLVADAADDDAARAWALHGAGIAANEAGDHERAIERAERSAALFDTLRDALGRATVLTLAGNAHKALGRYEAAQAAHLTSLSLARDAGDPRRITIALNNLGTLAHDHGEHDAARGHYTASLRIKQELGDNRGTAIALMNLGGLDNDLGRYADARALLRQAVTLLRGLGEPYTLAFALALLADSDLGAGDRHAAEASAHEALKLAREAEYGPAIGLALARLGDLALARDDPATADRYLTEALAHTRGDPDVARALEHLAVARAATDPAQARVLLDRAERLRHASRTPAPPADAALLDRVRQARPA